MKPQEVTDALKLTQLKDKIWFVVPSCATTGEGLLEGLVCTLLSQFVLMQHQLCWHECSKAVFLTNLQAWLSNNVKSPPSTAAPKK